MGQDALHQTRQPEEVHLKLAACFVDGHVFHGTVRTVAGIVYQHVDAPFGTHDFGHSGLDALVGSHVEMQSFHTDRRQSFDLFDTPRRTVDTMPLFGQIFGRLVADAAARTGEEDDLFFHCGRCCEVNDAANIAISTRKIYRVQSFFSCWRRGRFWSGGQQTTGVRGGGGARLDGAGREGRWVNEPFALSRARDTRARPPLFDFCLHSFTPMRQVAVDHGVRGEDFCSFPSPFRRFFFLFSMVP